MQPSAGILARWVLVALLGDWGAQGPCLVAQATQVAATFGRIDRLLDEEAARDQAIAALEEAKKNQEAYMDKQKKVIADSDAQILKMKEERRGDSIANGAASTETEEERKLDEEERGGASIANAAASTEMDDGGYQQVAEAALRGPGGNQISDGTLRRIVSARVREARIQHRTMKQFMRNFARNLKLSVLEDSKGDMPEAERLGYIAKLKKGEDIPIGSNASEKHHHAPEQSVHRRHRHHKHPHHPHQRNMLNGAPQQRHRESVQPQASLAQPVPAFVAQPVPASLPEAASLAPDAGVATATGADDGAAAKAEKLSSLLAEQREEDAELEQQQALQQRRQAMQAARVGAAEAEAAGCGPVPCPPGDDVTEPTSLGLARFQPLEQQQERTERRWQQHPQYLQRHSRAPARPLLFQDIPEAPPESVGIRSGASPPRSLALIFAAPLLWAAAMAA